MLKNTFLFILLCVILLSCNTGRPIKRATDSAIMYAMIYDYDNTPVSGVNVFINNRRIADSDIQGRFLLDNMKRGEYTVKLVRRGYETLEETFYFDPLQVLYFKIINVSQLIVLAETALDIRDFSNAENYISRILALEPARPDILFLQSVTYFLQNKNTEAINVLDNLIKSGITEPRVIQLREIVHLRLASEEE